MGDQSASYIAGHTHFEGLGGYETRQKLAKRVENIFNSLSGFEVPANSWGMPGSVRKYPIAIELGGETFDLLFQKILDRSNREQFNAILVYAGRINNSFGAGLLLKVYGPNHGSQIYDEHGEALSKEQLEGLAKDIEVLEARTVELLVARDS